MCMPVGLALLTLATTIGEATAAQLGHPPRPWRDQLPRVALPDLDRLELQWRSAWDARDPGGGGGGAEHRTGSNGVTAAIAGEQCAVTPVSALLTCNVSITLCSPDGKHFTANASAYRNGTLNKAVATGAAFGDPKSAFSDVYFRLLLQMDASPTSTDCSCEATDVPEGSRCTLRAAFCIYTRASGSLLLNNTDELRFRSRVWDAWHPEYTGESPGYQNISLGAADQGTAMVQAARNLRANFPARSCGTVPPLVIVPGFSSTQVQYRLQDVAPPPGHPFCRRNTDGWANLYPPPPNMSLLDLPCFYENLGTKFDPVANSFMPVRKGIETRVTDFGGFAGIPGFGGIVPYYEIGGWEINKTLFGVPFDWRLPSPASEPLFADMKALVEHASSVNGDAKVALWAFSGGPQWTLAFLHRMEQSWKDAFVSWFVATSPVWAGLPEALSGYISGATSPYQRGLSALVHALPSAMWFFPRAGQNSTTSWSKDDPVVLAKTKNYSAYDIPEIFADLGLSATAQAELAFLHAEPDLGGFAPPGVNTFVTYGTGFPSTTAVKFADDFAAGKTPKPPIAVVNETGDGLVPRRSSRRGLEWVGATSMAAKTLLHREYPGQPHAECFAFGVGADAASPNPSVLECYRDALSVLTTGKLPPRVNE